MGFDGLASDTSSPSGLLQSSSDILSNLRGRCEELDDALFMLDSSKKEIEGQINQCFQTILRCLEERKLGLFSDLETSLKNRRTVIEGLMKDMEERSQKINVSTEALKKHKVTENGTINGERSPKINESSQQKASESQLQKLLSLPIPIHPSVTDVVSYFPIDLDKLLSLIKNFGAIGMTSVDSDRTTIDDPTAEDNHHVMRCTVNETICRKVRAVDNQGRDVHTFNPKEFSVSLTQRPVQLNEASIVIEEPKSSSATTPENTVLLRLKFANPGIYDLNVKVLGEHIRGSPYKVHCIPSPGPFAKEWLSTFNEISIKTEQRWGELQYIKRSQSARFLPKMIPPPTALADKLHWNKNGMVFAIGARGRGISEFSTPEGAMFTRDSKIVIADSGNANVQVGFVLIKVTV